MPLLNELEGFTPDDVINIQAIFTDHLKIILAELTIEDNLEVTSFINRVLLIKPHYSFREDSLEGIHNLIFSTGNTSDFVLNLGFRFFSALGSTENIYKVASMLAAGLEFLGNNKALNILPKHIAQSLAQTCLSQSFKDPKISIADFLEANRHLMVILMIYLTNTLAIPPSQV